MVTWKIPDVHILLGWLTRQRRSKNKERSSTAGRPAWLQEIWPGRSLCRRPAGSAVWRTAAGCRPRPSLARCGPGPGWRSLPAARTRRDPPRSGRVAGNDLRFDSITAFCDPASQKSERQTKVHSSYRLLRCPLAGEPSPSWRARRSRTGYWRSLWRWARERVESLHCITRREKICAWDKVNRHDSFWSPANKRVHIRATTRTHRSWRGSQVAGEEWWSREAWQSVHLK